MGQNYQVFQKLVQLVCYQHNQNDLELLENRGMMSFLIQHFFLLFIFSMHPRHMDSQHHFQRDEVQLNEEELRQMAMRTHDTTPANVQPTPTPTVTANTQKTVPPPTAAAAAAAAPPSDKLINTAATSKSDSRNDGTLSDSVLTTPPESNKKRRPSMSSKALVILGLSKKTNSATNLGYGKYTFLSVKN
jgi:hypothetical protein